MDFMNGNFVRYFLFTMFRSILRNRWFFVVASCTVVNAVSLGQTLPKDSPFLPSANAAASDKPDAAYSLLGMTVVGKDTLLSISRLSDKQSTWIPVGKTVAEITALSYDAKSDQAVIRADGKLFTLFLHKAGVMPGPAIPPVVARATPASANPTPAPIVAGPGAAVPSPLPLTTQEEKETEARMLVSDLLEIGQEQRKAYELAQRQAAAGKTSVNPSGPQPAPANRP
jgi:hypothetical protein